MQFYTFHALLMCLCQRNFWLCFVNIYWMYVVLVEPVQIFGAGLDTWKIQLVALCRGIFRSMGTALTGVWRRSPSVKKVVFLNTLPASLRLIFGEFFCINTQFVHKLSYWSIVQNRSHDPVSLVYSTGHCSHLRVPSRSFVLSNIHALFS